MMDDRTGIKAVKVCGAMIFTFLLALLLSVQFDFYYDLNDDTMIKDILSGAYTGSPSGFCIQMLYPLGWCIALLYKAIPTVPWYGLFLCLCQFGVFCLIAVRLLFAMRSVWTRTAALVMAVFLTFGLFLREFVVIQYSVTSGICMAGAVFLFLTAPGTDKPSIFFRRNLMPLILVIMSFMVRTEVCMMLMPFLLLAGLVKWCGEDRFFTIVNFRKYVMLIITAVLCMAAVYSLDMVAYRGSDWSNFRSFFDARTKLYDFYGLPGYENNETFYESIGLSRESYTLLENYNFALDESIDTWRLEAIVAYQEQLARTAGDESTLTSTFGFVSKNSVTQALWLCKEQFFEDLNAVKNLILHPAGDLWSKITARLIVSITVIISYLLYVCICVVPARGKKRVMAVLKVVCLLGIRSLLWLYLYMVDRLPDRVVMPLLMMELIMLISFGICDHSRKDDAGRLKGTRPVIGLFCMAGVIAALAVNVQNVQEEYNKRMAADERWNAMMDYCRKNGNNYYVIDVYSATSYQGAYYSEKIFKNVDDSYKNYDFCGGWAAKSPLARQKLESYHFRDIQSALCSVKTRGQAGAYFVADTGKSMDWLVQYYEKRGITIETKCVDQIHTASEETAFDVYELVKK